MNDAMDELRARFDEIEDVDMGDVPVAGDGSVVPPAPSDGDGDGDDPCAACAKFPLNDIGNGQRFSTHFGRDVINVPRVGWHVWDGTRWAVDPDNLAVRALAHTVPDLVLREIGYLLYAPHERDLLDREDDITADLARLDAIAVKDRTQDERAQMTDLKGKLARIAEIKKAFGDRRKRHVSFALSSGNSAKLDHMITEASVAQARPFEDLDAAPLAVNVQNGTLIFSVDEGGSEGGGRVSGVQLVPHNRDLMQSKMMDVAYDPNATCPQFVAFLERVMPDAQMRAFLQRWFGLSMTALTGEQKLAFLYGQGANGKSVLMDLLGRILGDYAATAKIESLTGTNRRGGGDATPDLIPLMGARLVRAAEPEQGTRFQEAMIKDLLGGESMLVRQLQKEFVEVKPKFKLTISGNHKPEIRGTDDGIWRRVMLVPFDVQIPKAERDPLLGEKLWEERAGILNWLTGGLLDYLDGGLREPSTVTEATTEYRRDSDPLGTFLSDATDITGADEDWMTAKDLIAAAAFWMDDNIGGAWGTRTLSLRLKEKAGRWRHPDNGKCYTPAKRGVTGYKGIRLSREFERRRMEAGGQEAGTIPAQASYTPPDWDGDL